MKRFSDILICLLLLPAVGLVLAGAMLWIKADSRGPVLFRQARIGRQRQTFQILKLRTMIDRKAEDIDQISETVVTTASDQRITRSGRVLRALSIDELPQIWNVLKGDMTLVGPRPLLPEQLLALPQATHARFDVRPGITGLAQVRGRRSLGWLDQLKADEEYVAQRSVVLDIKILAQTVVVVLTGQGLYAGDAPNWRAYVQRQD